MKHHSLSQPALNVLRRLTWAYDRAEAPNTSPISLQSVEELMWFTDYWLKGKNTMAVGSYHERTAGDTDALGIESTAE